MKNVINTRLSYKVHIPAIKDEALLLFGEAKRHIPFQVKRFYLISNVDKGAIRGLHAHRNLQQVLFCIQGSVTLVLDNGEEREEIRLTKPQEGLFIDHWMWREMKEFSEDAILLVLASEYYTEEDYIRDYGQFLTEKKRLSGSVQIPAYIRTVKHASKWLSQPTSVIPFIKKKYI